MAEHEMRKVEVDDPHRCQASAAKYGQCQFMSMAGLYPDESKYVGVCYCPQHSGPRIGMSNERKAVSKYKLQLWQQRLEEFTETNSHKDLREEISMVRVLLETVWQECKDKSQLLIYAHKIGVLTLQLEKLVSSCERIEKNSGLHMDKTAAITLASRIVDVITAKIPDPELVDEISSGIIDVLKELRGV